MKGARKDNPEGKIPANGEYGIGNDGQWFGMTPNGHLANLSNHIVLEWKDGTITVTPSILVSSTEGRELWHGFLTEGQWIQSGQLWKT